jgi:hypothetical protein
VLLNLPSLPIDTRQAHIFPQLQHNALKSIGQLCDHGFDTLFTATNVHILQHSKPILTGTHHKATGLWQLNLTNKLHLAPSASYTCLHMTNSVYEMTTKADLITYLRKCCFSPTTSAWLKAIKSGFFMTCWPGLNEQIVNKLLPKSNANIKGHLRQKYKNTQLTTISSESDANNSPCPMTTDSKV